MAVKKSLSHKKIEPVELPDVFDEEAAMIPPINQPVEPVAAPEPPPLESTKEVLSPPRAPRIVTEVEEPVEAEEEVLEEPEISKSEAKRTEPEFTVRQNGETIKQDLPAFFKEEQAETSTTTDEPVKPKSYDEDIIPQAFVSEVKEVASEVKRERKGTLVTAFIIIGMVLVASGIVGLLFINTKKQGESAVATPTPTPRVEVSATPVPTPTIIVNTATVSAVPVSKVGVKVNVLNGTTIKGLASKEAAILKADGFTLGTVGNGVPEKAGTITAPKGKESLVEEIKTKLVGFTFTSSSTASGSAEITVTLGQPAQ